MYMYSRWVVLGHVFVIVTPTIYTLLYTMFCGLFSFGYRQIIIAPLLEGIGKTFLGRVTTYPV